MTTYYLGFDVPIDWDNFPPIQPKIDTLLDITGYHLFLANLYGDRVKLGLAHAVTHFVDYVPDVPDYAALDPETHPERWYAR